MCTAGDSHLQRRTLENADNDAPSHGYKPQRKIERLVRPIGIFGIAPMWMFWYLHAASMSVVGLKEIRNYYRVSGVWCVID